MISMVVEEKDLGVVFDNDLKFTSHVNQIVMKASRVLGIIKCIPGMPHNKIIIRYSCSPNFGLCINCLEPSSYEKHP